MSAPPEQLQRLPAARSEPAWSSRKQAAVGFGAILVMLGIIVAIALVSGASTQLRADVLSPRSVEPGEEFLVTISVRDKGGQLQRVEVDLGNGMTVVPVDREPPSGCVEEASSEAIDIDHVYPEAGVYTVRAVVVTGGCGARTERTEATRTIKVKKLGR